MHKIIYSLSLLLSAAFCLTFAACTDEYDTVTPSFADGANFIAYNADANYKGPREIVLARSSVIQLENVSGVQTTDEFAVRNKATGEMTYLKWGYEYAGLVGDENGDYDRVYDTSKIQIGLGYYDTWKIGDYELLLIRGEQAQVLDTFRFCILKDVETRDTKVQGGVFEVKAVGWDNPGAGAAIDSISIKEKISGRCVYRNASSCRGLTDDFEMIAFDRNNFDTGNYEVYVTRWNSGLSQKIGEFFYFNYIFVDSDPMKKDDQGRYQLKFKVDRFGEKDNFTVTTVSPYANYYVDQRVPFDPACYDEATQTYTYTLDDSCWRRKPEPGITFMAKIVINGNSTNISGTARLPE